MKVKLKTGIAAALLINCLPMMASADDGRLIRMVTDLQKQMSQMQKTIESQDRKINELQSRPAQIQVAPGATAAEPVPPMSDYEFNERLNTATGGAQKWLKDLSFKGDLRLRYEAFQQTSGATTETDDRNRFRYRLRFGFEKKFSDELKAGFGLASGESGVAGSNGLNVDPTSTNTTFDNNFNYKPVFIEKAFVMYNPNWAKVGPIEKATFAGGKLDNPFEKGSSDIVWDRDVKPEGFYEKFDFKLLDGETLDLKAYFTLGQFILDEDTTVGGDANLWAHQLGLNAVVYTPFLERPVDWLSAISYYSYQDYAHRNNFLIGTTSLARGNSNASGLSTDLDAEDFEIFEFYNEISLYPMGLPVRPFVDWAINLDNALDNSSAITGVGTEEDNAWALGVKLGGIQKKGDLEASYAYKWISANAVPGFNDSDFGTTGHSDKRGSVFKLGYGLTDNLTLNGAAFFVNNLNAGTSGILDEEQRRFQVDMVWKF